MRFQFRPLFTVEIAHAFYGGRCRDFAFVVPSATRRLLAGGRLLAREREGVLHVLFEADSAGDPRVGVPRSPLRFGLRLLNPGFGNFTVLPAGFPARVLYYANASDPSLLAPEEGPSFVGPLFSHAPTGAARPVDVTLRDAAGDAVETHTLETGDESAPFDLRGRADGLLSLEEVYPDETVAVSLFLDDELRRQGAVGIVEIRVDDAFHAAPPAFEIAFDAREDVLRYYLVTRNHVGQDFDRLDVSDEGFAEDGRAEVVFQKVLPADFTPAELAPALIAGPDEAVVLFRSQAPLARRERGRRRIQLSRHNDVLVPNLPQPGADRPTADLIIHVSKP